LAWFGLVWFGLVWFGLVWFGLVWFGSVRFGLNKTFFLFFYDLGIPQIQKMKEMV